MRKLFLILPLAALLPIHASSAEDVTGVAPTKLTRTLQGLTAGKPVSCIELRDVRSTEAVDDALIFKAHRKLLYRTDPRGGCPGASFGRTFVTRTYGGRLCRGDIVTSVDLLSGFETGHCIVGDFTPYRTAP